MFGFEVGGLEAAVCGCPWSGRESTRLTALAGFTSALVSVLVSLALSSLPFEESSSSASSLFDRWPCLELMNSAVMAPRISPAAAPLADGTANYSLNVELSRGLGRHECGGPRQQRHGSPHPQYKLPISVHGILRSGSQHLCTPVILPEESSLCKHRAKFTVQAQVFDRIRQSEHNAQPAPALPRKICPDRVASAVMSSRGCRAAPAFWT